MMRTHLGIHAVVLSVLLAADATAASIDLYSTPDCTSTLLHIAEGATDTLYIRASTEGLMYPILTAGFRVSGLPSNWVATSIADPTIALALGDPFSQEGTTLAYTTSVTGSCISFFTVIIEATTMVEDVVLEVTDKPDPPFGCPYVFEDCPPCDFHQTCVEGGQLFINPTTPVQYRTWTAVRQLFR